MKEITIKELLEAGTHFGHQKHRWNPKMKRFIFEKRDGICIIDLAKTLQQIRDVKVVLQDVVTKRKPILFVGTKKQAKDVVKECAEECSEFYVAHRWLGGTLTNFSTIKKSVKTLERLEKKVASKEGMTKKEFANYSKEQQKLEKVLSGIRSMRKMPGLLIVVDAEDEHIAVSEAKKLHIPVLALIDTNGDPDKVDYVIACNDDSVKSNKLILSYFKDVIKEKKKEIISEKIKKEVKDE